MYCGRHCQETSWRYHSPECKAFIKTGRIATNAMTIVCRAFWKARNSQISLFDTEFGNLQSHRGDLSVEEELTLAPLATLIRSYLDAGGWPSESLPRVGDIFAALSVMMTNSFNILDADMTECGVGIFPSASLFNHSCDPNVVITFNGIELQAKAIKDVQEGEELFISYVDNLSSRMDRRSQLKKQYYFDCTCLMCESKKWDDIFSAVRCQFQCTLDDNAIAVKYQCNAAVKVDGEGNLLNVCIDGHPQDIPALDRYMAVEEIDERLAKAKETADMDDAIKLCDRAIKSARRLLHQNSTRLTNTSNVACDIAIKVGRFDKAYDYGVDSAGGILRKLSEGYDPRLGIQCMRMAKLGHHVYLQGKNCNDKTNIESYIKDAIRILSVTHGENHHLVAEARVLLREVLQ
eukprot:CFRG1127T1